MIQDLEISNFRCFKALHIRDLSRFNVIVGRSGAGKTALLEALFFLASGGPQPILKIRQLRGLGEKTSISADTRSFRSLWRDFFFDFDEASTIELRSRGTDENARSLRVSYGSDGATVPFGEGSVDTLLRHATIDFEYEMANGRIVGCQVALTNQGLSFGAMVETFPAIFLSPAAREDPERNGQRFSFLSKRGEHEAVVSVIRKQFPFIENLSVEYSSDGTAMVHAKLHSMSEKVPLPLVSDGINKMLSILLAVDYCSHGIVLIDEMENGLYFDLMGRASKAILDAARESNTQLFVTTHSLEYLRALLPVAQEHPDDFQLLRTTNDNGASEIDCFDGRHFAAALEESLEIR